MKKKEKREPSPWVEDLSFTRFKDGKIAPKDTIVMKKVDEIGIFDIYQYTENSSIPRKKKEFWPNEGIYKTKMKRA